MVRAEPTGPDATRRARRTVDLLWIAVDNRRRYCPTWWISPVDRRFGPTYRRVQPGGAERR